MKHLLLILSLFLLEGCSIPSKKKMYQEISNYTLPKSPKKNEAVIFIVRPSIRGIFRRAHIYINKPITESNVGWTRGRQYLYLAVAPGTHKIYSKIDNLNSISINAKKGDIIFLKQQISIGFMKTTNTLVQIGETEGKYLIKNTSIGTFASQ